MIKKLFAKVLLCLSVFLFYGISDALADQSDDFYVNQLFEASYFKSIVGIKSEKIIQLYEQGNVFVGIDGERFAKNEDEIKLWRDRNIKNQIVDRLKNLSTSNPKSFTILCKIYYQGLAGISKNMDTAIDYCLQGIQNNEIYSLSTLGDIYGTQENYAESFKYLEQAAKKGEFIAQYNLGVMYERGNGVAQSYAEAARLYRLAVEQGYSPAQNNLALLYYVGLGVKEDKQQARGLFQSAADQGYGLAIKNLDELF